MALQEIERKFLVKNDAFKAESKAKFRIVQAYLNTDPVRNVRVRIKGEQGFLTIKGASTTDGTTRFEWEKEISLAEAEALLPLCEPGKIDKYRYLVAVDGFTFEVDEFFGDNQGLIIAEIELEQPDQAFPKPQWLGEEVTGKTAYYNAHLIQYPYKEWA